MRVFVDPFSGSELFTDAVTLDVEEDGVYHFVAKLTKEKSGDIDDSLIGGNASAEEQQEQMECTEKFGLDFVLSHRLKEGCYAKKDFKGYVKAYAKKLKDQLVAQGKDPAVFEPQASKLIKRMLEIYDDVCLYFGEGDDECEGTCCFVQYRDADHADVWVLKEGVKEVKY